MPELPEVETIARQLDRVLTGQRVKSVDVLREKSFVGEPKSLVGKKVEGVDRKAKVLIFDLGKLNVLVHLKMTGQLIFEPNKERKRVVGGHPTKDWVGELPSSHTRIVAGFDDGSTLFFNDMRVVGWWKVVNEGELEEVLGKMPADVIDRQMSGKKFFEMLQRSRRAVKLVIMDSQKIGGVGNIYACDGLNKAKINPRREANSLSREESGELLKALRQVVRLGIELGGATAADDKFVQSTGLGGKYQERFLVYERGGEGCKNRGCGGVIGKIKLGGRGTYFCPVCQK